MIFLSVQAHFHSSHCFHIHYSQCMMRHKCCCKCASYLLAGVLVSPDLRPASAQRRRTHYAPVETVNGLLGEMRQLRMETGSPLCKHRCRPINIKFTRAGTDGKVQIIQHTQLLADKRRWKRSAWGSIQSCCRSPASANTTRLCSVRP